MHNHTMLSQERLEQQSEEIKKMREATAELNLYESLQKHFLQLQPRQNTSEQLKISAPYEMSEIDHFRQVRGGAGADEESGDDQFNDSVPVDADVMLAEQDDQELDICLEPKPVMIN